MPRQNNKRGQKNRGTGQNRVSKLSQAMLPHPPSLQNMAITHGTRLRFTVIGSGLFNGAITYQNLLDTLVVASSSSVVYDVFNFVKIRAIEVWGPPNTGSGQQTTVSVVFSGDIAGAVGDLNLHTDTSMGVQPAYIKCRPSARSQASQYQPSSGDVAFTLYAPLGGIVDVDLSFKQQFYDSVVAANGASSAVTGATYFRGLDGAARGATALLPVLSNLAI